MSAAGGSPEHAAGGSPERPAGGSPKRAAGGSPRMTAGPPRFGFELLLARLLRYRTEADAGETLPEAMDRLRVLRRLQAELGVEAELLLQRGFDKAYRRAVEGV